MEETYRFQNQGSCHDLIVIGGGIHGAGIACDAAGRGLKVCLLEAQDFASGTSSKSSKLIHGGLRYLEQFHFSLVREALHERELILKKVPHLAKSLQFYVPHHSQSRPLWLVWLGLKIYGFLAPRGRLGRSEKRQFTQSKIVGFQHHITRGFSYWDGWVDDARLVIANVLQAQKHGAHILPRTKFLTAKRKENLWHVQVRDEDSGEETLLQGKVLINAAGPWALNLSQQIDSGAFDVKALPVRGSHIVVPKLYDGNHATLLQNDDGRVVLTMPYEDKWTLVGTTDRPHEGCLRDVCIDEEEEAYLLDIINRYFHRQTENGQIIHRYSGVRPLFARTNDDATKPSKISRESAFKTTYGATENNPPLLTILGGKLTSFRAFSKEILDELKPLFPTMTQCLTKDEVLPGGDIPNGDFEQFTKDLSKGYPWLDEQVANRLAQHYGTRVFELLSSSKEMKDLGTHFGGGLYEIELCFLHRTEWARHVDDYLLRRTKYGLHLNELQWQNVAEFVLGLEQKDSK